MKNFRIEKTLIVVLLFFIAFSSRAQKKLKEKDLVGTTWKMVFKVEDKIKEEAEDSDTILEEAIINFVSTAVGKTLDNLEIYFYFKNENKLITNTKAMGDEETNEGTWRITKDGKLRFDTNHISVNKDKNEDWFLYDGILIQKSQLKGRAVYMIKVD